MSMLDPEYSWLEHTLASYEVLRTGMFPANENLQAMSGPYSSRRVSSMTAPLGEILNQSTLNHYLRRRIPAARNMMEADNDPSPVISPISSPAPPPLFTSSPVKPNINHSRYKTEICRSFKEQGHCKYGEKCQFAHGADELRTNNRHPKYKTERCRTFHSNGYCPYGPRCHFIHGEDDEKLTEIRSNRSSRHPSGQSVTQFSSSPPTPKLPLMSDSALGLPFPDSTSISSSMRGQVSSIHGLDDSSNDSLLSFVDMELPPDSSTQMASPMASLSLSNRAINIPHPSSLPLSGSNNQATTNSSQIIQPKRPQQNEQQSIRTNQQLHNLVHGPSPTPMNRLNQHAIRFL